MSEHEAWETALAYEHNQHIDGLVAAVRPEFDRVCAERDALKTLVLEAREELTHHGWGDFHYGTQPQDASVVAIIAKIDRLLIESDAQ